MFFAVAISVLFIIHGYVAWRILPALGLTLIQSLLAYTLVFIVGLFPIVPILMRLNGSESKLLDKFSILGYTSLGFFVLSFIILLFKDIFLNALSFIQYLSNNQETLDNSRREFIKRSLSIGTVGISGLASAYGYYHARKGPRIIEQNIFIYNLPEQFENFEIIQISDLHVGPTIKRHYVEDVVEKVGTANPDLIAITGDLVDGSVKYLRDDVEPLKELKAEFGTFFVTGNHEYYSGVDMWLDETNRLGMINLINDYRILSKDNSSIAIAGITDYRAHQIKPSHKSSPKSAVKSLDKDIIKIMLAHQPNSIYAVHEAGVHLQLSGHTHGGQFWPFIYPTKLANSYLAGHYDHYGTQIYVNRGTGYWGPPLRIGVPSEITLIRLRRKSS